MIKDPQSFFEKQNLVQKLMRDYRHNARLKLKNIGYSIIEDRNNYLVMRARKNNPLIEIPKRKIYYANIMPESIDKIMPLDDEPVTEDCVYNAINKLEKVAAAMCTPAMAEFAFGYELSLSILGDELFYEGCEHSVHIPINEFEYPERLIGNLEECIKPKKKKLFF